MVPGLFYADTQRCLHRSQEKPEMGTSRGMGGIPSVITPTRVLTTACIGNAILQFYISCTILGI
jgi:hypothetical protein